jgi:hypothetical protein
MAKRWGPVRLGNQIQTIRSVLNHGYEAKLLDKPVDFGPSFEKPSAKVLRKRKAEKAKKGARDFKPDEILRLLAAATPRMKPMVLLGINGGMGPADLAALPISAIERPPATTRIEVG